MEPIRNERMEIVGYREQVSGGRLNIHNKHREFDSWTQFGQARSGEGAIVSFQENEREGLRYRELD